jgi:threonine aldolase
MKDIQRREFVKISSIAALLSSISLPSITYDKKVGEKKAGVSFMGDGLHLSTKEYSQLLSGLTEKNTVTEDSYSIGGCVAELEDKFASLLGMEAAIFMPTGTLANQIAIRSHCGQNHRAIVQQESHVYNDTGDASQILSNLNLLPLGFTKASFTVEEVEEVIKNTESGRVSSRIGAISIESPVRRKLGETFDFSEMKKISDLARKNNIKMHLDGARIFLATPYTGINVKEYCSLFDSAYVSLYKYFNAASGAILAGSKSFIEPLFHTRRMFGSGLSQAWPFTLIANYYVDGFEERYAKSVAISETLFTNLAKHNQFIIHKIPNGTNITKLVLENVNAKMFTENLLNSSIHVGYRASSPNEIILQTNESLINSTALELENIFIKSLSS